ncbi:MAG TPA: 3-methyl-2-oxobutanoate hydroxymethyltransferase, partial [Candidatus Acidoferrales bacterium]|nr:3-methyl-2-oxobutanoate hydroxymethyltransferase [Candidatus Acidoferrales bacterium]
TIGIGAGPQCDGQVLMSHDVLGLFDTFVLPFVKRYAQLGEMIPNAAKNYANDVREGALPHPAVVRRDHTPSLAKP